eukprot:570387-Prymnesium_polylepis.2
MCIRDRLEQRLRQLAPLPIDRDTLSREVEARQAAEREAAHAHQHAALLNHLLDKATLRAVSAELERDAAVAVARAAANSATAPAPDILLKEFAVHAALQRHRDAARPGETSKLDS